MSVKGCAVAVATRGEGDQQRVGEELGGQVAVAGEAAAEAHILYG